MPENDIKLKALGTYIDGKIKRYNLMFAVNGGIFALAKIITAHSTDNPLGHLRLIHLGIGAIAFTFLMWFDIWLWGENMRNGYFDGGEVFLWRGKTILSMLSSLLIAGWLLAIFGWCTSIAVFASLVILGALLTYHATRSVSSKRKNGTAFNAPHA